MKNNTAKRIMSLIISMALVLSFLPQAGILASAATIVNSGECGDTLPCLSSQSDDAWAGSEAITVYDFQWNYGTNDFDNNSAISQVTDYGDLNPNWKFQSLWGQASLFYGKLRIRQGRDDLRQAANIIVKLPETVGFYTLKATYDSAMAAPQLDVYVAPTTTETTYTYELSVRKAFPHYSAVLTEDRTAGEVVAELGTFEVTEENKGTEVMLIVTSEVLNTNADEIGVVGSQGFQLCDFILDGAPNNKFASVELASSRKGIAGTETAQLSVKGYYNTGYEADLSNATIVYSTEDTDIVNVTADGVVTAKGEGTATITATVTAYGATATDTITIAVGDTIAWAGADNNVTYVLPDYASTNVDLLWKAATEEAPAYEPFNTLNWVLEAEPTYVTNNNWYVDGNYSARSIIIDKYARLAYRSNNDSSFLSVIIKLPEVAGVYSLTPNYLCAPSMVDAWIYDADVKVTAADLSTEADNYIGRANIAADGYAYNGAIVVTPDEAGTFKKIVFHAPADATAGSNASNLGNQGFYLFRNFIILDGTANDRLSKIDASIDNAEVSAAKPAQISVSGVLNTGVAADLSSATITYTTANEGIVSVSSTGLVTAVGSGFETITVSVTLDGVTVTDTVTVFSGPIAYGNEDVKLSFGRDAVYRTPNYDTAPDVDYPANRTTGEPNNWKFHSTNIGSDELEGSGQLYFGRTYPSYEEDGTTIKQAGSTRMTTNWGPGWFAIITKYPAPGKYTLTYDYFPFDFNASQVAFWVLPATTTDVAATIATTAPTNVIVRENIAYIDYTNLISAPFAAIDVTPEMTGQEVMIVVKSIARSVSNDGRGGGRYSLDFASITFDGEEMEVPAAAPAQIRAAEIEAEKDEITSGETAQLTVSAEMTYTTTGDYAIDLSDAVIEWSVDEETADIAAITSDGLVSWLSAGEAIINVDVTYNGVTATASKKIVCTEYVSPTIVDSGECGNNLTWTLDINGLLTISGTGAMYDIWNDLDFINNSLIKSVVIEDGVTTIADSSFRGCENLTSVTIPDSVTLIGAVAFQDCTSLSDVYYSGTEGDWNSVTVSDFCNEPLLNATIHFTVAEINEETKAFAKKVKSETNAIKDGSSEVSALIDEINAQIDAVANDASLSFDEAKTEIEKLKNEVKMRCGVLNLRFQITSGTTSSSTKSDIRFISTVDNLKNYKETGFYITINGIKKRIATKNVYSSLVGKNGAAITNYAPGDIFSESKYFSTYSIWNIPNSAFNSEITVQAFVLLKDGTEILGVEKTRTVSNFIASYN